MAFDRDKSDERKEWIRRSENEITNEDDGKTEISYQEFVDGQLMQFGMVDLKRYPKQGRPTRKFLQLSRNGNSCQKKPRKN